MSPTLTALTGPLKGQAFELAGEEITLGRHRSNQLQISDLSVSRHHCRLIRMEDQWRVEDLDSRDGTFVNGRPVKKATLGHNDVLLVCHSAFLLTLDDLSMPSQSVQAEVPVDAETAMALAVEDSAFLQPDELERALESGNRTIRSLGALLEIAAATQTHRDLESFARALLTHTLKTVPAERAALLRVERDGAFSPCQWLSPGEDGAFPLSRTMIGRCLEERQVLLVRDLAEEDVGQAHSVVQSGARSLACVPMLARGELLAILYLDARRVVLGEEHLEWLAALSALASGALDSLLAIERLRAEQRRLQGARLGHGLLGESPSMRRVSALLEKAAPSASTILLLGESGTGKELAARAVHAASPRADGPFVAINCATLSETLLESELFGHEKGAFTGAVARKEGKLEVARGGTLFLDEVGELPMTLQAKLLRVLQERVFERVGSNRPTATDLRLVAATNRDLEQAIGEGAFRQDLYYRLAVITVTMPPLRDRREDISLLAQHFATLHGQAIRHRSLGISFRARALLESHDWPGNVRELSNAIERAAVLGQGDEILPEDLPEALLECQTEPQIAEGTPVTYHEALNQAKERLIRAALDQTQGNVTQAARTLSLHPNHLHRLITNLGLRSPEGQGA